jgi:hypothetical protein
MCEALEHYTKWLLENQAREVTDERIRSVTNDLDKLMEKFVEAIVADDDIESAKEQFEQWYETYKRGN